MIYRLHQLDGRHSHNRRFQYYLEFSANMANRSGPLHFNDAMAWCIRTWGWSAEVNQTARIMSWTVTSTALNLGHTLASAIMDAPPDYCNPNWSWTNRIGDDLRIYLQGPAELAWFQLAHPVDQKIKK